jgi:flavin reductase (DIM6/NTAB) family NADH-FMN oxidoreductase RutF
MNVDPLDLRLAMRHWATGVTIASVAYQGVQHGMTVSSFTSVTLLPPVVLISLERITRTHDLILEAGFFGITILSDQQQALSERFAGSSTEDEDRFAGLETETLTSGAPFLVGGLAFVDCKVISTHEFATNTLFIAEVMDIKIGVIGKPLLYYNRRYYRLKN